MFTTFKRFFTLVGFVRWLIPDNVLSLRFCLSLTSILIYSRQSVYRHFRSLKEANERARIGEFLRVLENLPNSRQTSIPSTLLTRLLRTIYLTEVIPREGRGGPNKGYVNHPQFSYGSTLRSCVPQHIKTNDRY
jgi:hypothetical protein